MMETNDSRGRAKAIPLQVIQDGGEIICQCAGISRGRIQAVIATTPASTLESLGIQLGCAVQCGCCRPLVQELLGASPWYKVTAATRTILTDAHQPERRIVQIEMQLAGNMPYPLAMPAQHVVLQAWINNAWVTRTYTVVDQTEDGNTVCIAMRRHYDGQLSKYLLDADEATFSTTKLRIAAPDGEADPADGRPIVVFVAGVGVTLALSLLKGNRHGHRLHIDYSAAHRGDMAYADRIARATSCSREISCSLRNDDVDGYIHDADILKLARQFSGARFYVCGPNGYSHAVVGGLKKAGVSKADVRIEAFFLKPEVRRAPRIRRLAYAAGMALACLPLLLLAPALAEFVPNNSRNFGHNNFECSACHRDAPGSTRQQLQAKAKHLLGMRQQDAHFGMQPVNNTTCIACHENPDDQHPAFRFLEPRFSQARSTLAPEQCVSCHREHTDMRVSQVDTGFCATCHSDVEVESDTTRPTHAQLAHDMRWDTCLSCHDFHGNHAHTPPVDLKNGIAPSAIAAYFHSAESPYGKPVIKGKKPKELR